MVAAAQQHGTDGSSGYKKSATKDAERRDKASLRNGKRPGRQSPGTSGNAGDVEKNTDGL